MINLAVFNIRDAVKDGAKDATVPVPVKLIDIGLTGSANVLDLWTGKDAGLVGPEFSPEVPFHGARLFRLKASR